MTKTALVTGGAGFIASHMADRLIKMGYDVTVIDNESTGLRQNVPADARYVRGDLTNPADAAAALGDGVDLVLHLAGLASTVLSFDNPLRDLSNNVIGTLNLIQACLERQVPRLLYASSMTSYGHPQAVPVREEEAPRPISYYGITKYTAERYLMATAERKDLKAPFDVTAFRMFNVYGERQRLDNPYQGVMGYFIGNVLRQETITIHSDGEQTRDFVYISDVVDAWMASIENPAAHQQFFNIGCGEAISMNRLVDALLQANGESRATHPVVYGPERSGDQRHMTADISKARTILGWNPQVTLADGVARTLAWARQQ